MAESVGKIGDSIGKIGESMGKLGESIGKIGEPIGESSRYPTHFSIFIKRLKTQLEKLECRKLDTQLLVDEGTRNNEIIGHDVRRWMDGVSNVEARAAKIFEGCNQLGNRCCGCLVFNLVKFHALSERARDTTEEIIALLNEGRFDRVSYPQQRAVVDGYGNGVLFLDATYAQLQPCRQFTFAEIQSATQNFNETLFIGRGGFGKVYKGFFNNGTTTVAVKRLNVESSQGNVEFRTEIEMLSKFRHCHLVSLIGYCHEDREMILVYEFILNGSLADNLHPKDGQNRVSSNLSWVQRLKICIGAARGLDYLHTGTGVLERVIHRDIKSSNILLDENWAAKISDFGLCKVGPANQSCSHVSTRVKGTPGYCDPEYYFTHRVTKESDVYAFGVVLFEVLYGKPAVDSSLPEGQRYLARRVQQSIKDKENQYRLIDPNLEWQIFSNSLDAFVAIGARCLESDSIKRPKMFEVVAALESALALQMNRDSLVGDDNMFDFGKIDDDPEKEKSEIIKNHSNELEAKANGNEPKIETNENEAKSSNDNRLCRNCGKVESCVLVLPCRHLCLCTKCELAIQACPICDSAKDATITINVSI